MGTLSYVENHFFVYLLLIKEQGSIKHIREPSIFNVGQVERQRGSQRFQCFIDVNTNTNLSHFSIVGQLEDILFE